MRPSSPSKAGRGSHIRFEALPTGSSSRWSLFFLLGPFFGLLLFFWAIPLGLGVDLALQNPEYMPDHRGAGSLSDGSSGQGVGLSPVGSLDWLNVSWEPVAEEPSEEVSAPVEKYVGLANYSFVLGDPKFHKALWNTSLYVAGTLAFVLPIAFFLAHFLMQLPAGIRPFFSFLLLLPGLCLPGVLSTLFHLFFHGREGALNQFIVVPLGFEPVNWMMDPTFVLPSLILQSVWRWTGFVTLFFLCGMEAVPKLYYEAARIEGASSWRTLRCVTLPAVRHVAVFTSVFLIVDGFASFSGAYNLLGGSGGILDSGLLLVSYVYQVAFPGGSGQFDFPAAAAMSLLVVPMTAMILFALLFLRFRPDFSR